MKIELINKKILVTGGAGFIGSNLCEALLEKGNKVVCLDNFATGKRKNIEKLLKDTNFTLIEGDIRKLEDCLKASKDVDYVLHQAALGSVPRSIKDPITSNDVNVSGFLNMLVAARDNGVKRYVYAASSSTYGDSESMPKVEDIIGKPLSPYAITKYVNELYADIFSKTYALETIGLRYFNVFGRNQDPNGAYAAVIPKFISQLMKGESPVINGDGNYSRDFTYIDNVIQANLLSLVTTNEKSINTVYNVAYGDRNTLNDLMGYLKEYLSEFDSEVKGVKVIYGPNRAGDIPHSHASVEKAKELLNYNPHFSLPQGLKEAVKWYWENL
ncbi:MAG: SDR family oxidoreductase [Flavobacteriales bacterium]|nr:SDR family oxidoreductase [Flavobacteriales bacterium]